MKYLQLFENYNKQQLLNNDLLKYSNIRAALSKIRELISEGADVNYRQPGPFSGETPLMNAASAFFYSAVKLFIENGADVNAVDMCNRNALIRVAYSILKFSFEKNETVKKIIDLLIISGIDLNVREITQDPLVRGLTATRSKNKDAFELSPTIKEYVKNKFPKEYEHYLIKKNAENYNI